MCKVPLVNLIDILAADIDASFLEDLFVLGFRDKRLLTMAGHLSILYNNTLVRQEHVAVTYDCVIQRRFIHTIQHLVCGSEPQVVLHQSFQTRPNHFLLLLH